MLQPIRADRPLMLRVASVHVACGFPSPADDYLDDPIDLIERLAPNKNASFLFKVAGHSMAGAHVHDGDVAIVDRSVPPKPGHIVVACVAGGFVMKELRERGGRTQLYSVPAIGPPEPYAAGEEVQVWGVVRSTVTPHKADR